MASGLKGIQVTSETFKIIIILLIMVIFVAIAILASIFYNNSIREDINSEQKICETFESNPNLGQTGTRCPEEGPLEKFVKTIAGS